MAGEDKDLGLAHALTRAERQVATELAARLDEMGVTIEQWRVLRVLADGQGHPMSEVATAALLPPPTLTKVVDRLVEAALVHRRSDLADRRRVLVLLTARGRALYRRLDRVVSGHAGDLEARLGAGDARLLSQLLDRLVAAGHVT